MSKKVKKVAVTGGAGQIAYSLLFRIASGELFGFDQPIDLHIIELPASLKALEGVKMELQDCAYPLLRNIKIGSDPLEMFEDIDYAIFVGAKPRGPGMERKDLLAENGKIFVEQGKALNQSAKNSVLSFVVGNPCNTNCLVLMHNAPDIPKTQFHAMTRLDQNRACYQLAEKAKVDVAFVENMIIWGNHSSTQVPDFYNATIKGKPVTQVIQDEQWLMSTFIETIQKRGAAIIEARGKSSAASAANAIIDGMKALVNTHSKNKPFSSAIWSKNNPYGIDEELIFSFPCKRISLNNCDFIAGIDWNAFIEEKIKKTEQELKEEREAVAHLLNR